MNFIARNYGTFIFLLLIGGLALGAGMANKGIQVDLGTVAGYKIALTNPSSNAAPAQAGSTVGSPQSSGPVVTPSAAQQTPAAGEQQQSATTRQQTPVAGTATSSGVNPGSAQSFARPASGTVQKVDGKTITLTSQDGSTAKATVSDTTVYQKNASITTADIKVGDAVVVTGQDAGDGSINAQAVTVGAGIQGAASQGGQARGGTSGGQLGNVRMVTGTLQKVDGNTLTIAVEGGQSATVNVTGSTRVSKASPATLSDVTAGEQITVVGQAGTDGTIAATAVQIGSLR